MFYFITINFINRRGGIPAIMQSGEKLVLYIGIIDILQSYRFAKKLEHTFKSFVIDGVSKILCLIKSPNILMIHNSFYSRTPYQFTGLVFMLNVSSHFLLIEFSRKYHLVCIFIVFLFL